MAIEKWTALDGLPSSSIKGLARTQDGYLWVGTTAGLARFDGVEFKKVERDRYPLLQDGSIQYLTAGPDSQLYVGLYEGGLLVLNKGIAHIYGKAQGLRSSTVNMVLPIGEDEAWVGTEGGYLYHYAHGAVSEVASATLHRDPIYGLARSPDGTLWIGTGGGLFLLTSEGIARYQPRVPLPVSSISDLAVTSNGSIFAATDHGLIRINGDQWRSWGTSDGLPNERVAVLAAAPGNRLWVGTATGLAEMDGGGLHSIPSVGCFVLALQADLNGGVWAGCQDAKGFVHVRQPVVSMLPLRGKFTNLWVNALAESRAGVLWLGSQAGLLRVQNDKNGTYGMVKGVPEPSILSVSLAPDDSVWVGTDDGFARVRQGHVETFRTLPPGPLDPILSVLEDHSGTVWVGAGRGLLRRQTGQREWEEVPGVRGEIWSLREDREGNVWIATGSAGVFRYSHGQYSHFTVACGLASNRAFDTAQTSDGSIWAITLQGLSRIRNGVCATLHEIDGLPPGKIVGIADDGQGFLWLKAGKGVVALEIEGANRILDGKGGDLHARFFGRGDGFGEDLWDTPIMNTLIRHSSGEMWFAMVSGVGVVDPSILRTTSPPLDPVVNSAISDLGEHDVAHAVVLRAGDRRLEFSFSAPSVSGASVLEYRYRLSGFDETWRLGEQKRSASYTSLPVGTYQFQISVRRPFGLWSQPSAALEVRVLPHFYQTWWWYTLLAAVAVTIFSVIYRLRLVAVRRQYAALLAERLNERSRLARELHDTLSQGMVGIHLQIEAAQVLIDKDPKTARLQMEKVDSIVRGISLETRRSISALRSQDNEETSIYDLLERTIFRWSQRTAIPLIADFDHELPSFGSEALHEIGRIVEEALANVRLHSGARHVYLTVRRSDNALFIEVRDDGNGFEVSACGTSFGNHFGIVGMEERARRIYGRLSLHSAPGEGATLSLEVPVYAKWHRKLIFQSHSFAAMAQRYTGEALHKLRRRTRIRS